MEYEKSGLRSNRTTQADFYVGPGRKSLPA